MNEERHPPFKLASWGFVSTVGLKDSCWPLGGIGHPFSLGCNSGPDGSWDVARRFNPVVLSSEPKPGIGSHVASGRFIQEKCGLGFFLLTDGP